MEQTAEKPDHPLKGKPRKDPRYWTTTKAKRRMQRLAKLGALEPGEARVDKIVLDDGDIEQIRMLAGLHLSLDEIAAILGISKETLRRRRMENPDIDEAIAKGKAQSKRNVTATAYKMATGGKSATMTQFWLETQGKWKKTVALELKRGVEELSEEELQQRLDDLRKLNDGSNGEPY